jgi:serine/threonine protein kinase/tetratricopeptide (TPR) repeat protein
MVGKLISHYRILEELGRGGMGVVYKAQDTKLDRFVALKFLPPHLLSSEEEKLRFVREAKAAASLDHPYICTVHEIDEADGQSFMVMAYIDGQSLKEKIAKSPSKIEEAVDIAIQIGEGLQEAHEKGIVHRDIKSANIMFTSKGQLKITDFGLAKLSGQTKLTKADSTLGTIAYMSSEQTQGIEVDHRTDIWSLGVILYEMITGQLPFKGDYEQAVVYSIVNQEPEPMTGLRTGVPVELEQYVNKCLAKDPKERYPSIEGLVVDLKRLKKDTSKISTAPYSGIKSAVTTPPTVTKLDEKETTTIITLTPRRKKLLTILAATLSILMLVVAALVFIRGDDTIDSLAILPFENVSGDVNTEYLSEGIPESIITSLQKIPGLKITSFNSVLKRFKNVTPEASDVRDEFDVDAVVMGRISLRGEDISVSIEIVETRNNNILAAENFLEKFLALVNIQPRIAREITERLSIELSTEDENRVFTLDSQDSEAYDKYMIGRYHWRYRTIDGLNHAIEYFKQAIEIDREYALAYSGLADCYILSPDYRLGIPDYLQKAKEAAEKSLEYGPDLAESHTSMGYVYYWEGNIENGRREFKKAFDINPDYPTAHYWYGEMMSKYEGRHEEGIEEIKKALELDPYSVVINLILGRVYRDARRFHEAVEQLQKTIEQDPDWPYSYMNLAGTYMLMNEHDKATKLLEELEADKDLYIGSRYFIGISYLIKQDYKKAIEEFRKIPPDVPGYGVGEGLIALTYSLMGQYRTSIDLLVQNAKANGDPFVDEIYNRTFRDGVFNEETFRDYFKSTLEKAVEVNHPVLKNPQVMNFIYLYAKEYDMFFVGLEESIHIPGPAMLALPFYDPVRNDPRFVKLWERYGLSKYYK